MTQAVGFIGLGRMGSRIARNIAKGGFPLVVHNRTRDRAEAFAAEVGADVAGTPAEAAAASDVVVTMLSDDAAVGAVYDGPDRGRSEEWRLQHSRGVGIRVLLTCSAGLLVGSDTDELSHTYHGRIGMLPNT